MNKNKSKFIVFQIDWKPKLELGNSAYFFDKLKPKGIYSNNF